jgi:16S rRNA (guanine(966)-N(2))-methyltransferase RsmD
VEQGRDRLKAVIHAEPPAPHGLAIQVIAIELSFQDGADAQRTRARVRVIAGRLGGRTLVAPRGAATRPTSDRVREALFSILGSVDQADVLDLYAGTGALGIEALSRGASSATFVEHERAALRSLRQNIDRLGLGSTTKVWPTTVERALSTTPWGLDAFDVVFVDPPYALLRAGRLSSALAKLLGGALGPSIRAGGRAILEHGRVDSPPELHGLTLEDTRGYGDTALSFYIR